MLKSGVFGDGAVKPERGGEVGAPPGSGELLHRVAGSLGFQKSKRLRELLLYLGERALENPSCVLHEQEIGVDVLGRAPDYDTSHDTLVRVQISQLRKRLQEFFATEGHDEPVIIEIPKGSYVPVFRARSETVPELEQSPHAAKPAVSGRSLLAGIAIGLTLAALAWAVYGMAGHAGGRSVAQRPTVDAFWTQLFGNSQTTYLVVSDVTLIEFQKLMGRPVPLSEYEVHEFDRLAQENIADPVQRALARGFVNRIATSVSDVQVARDFGVLAAERHLSLNVVSARDLSSAVLSSQNVILLGSQRANPWVGLFEEQMAFQTDYQENPPSVRFVNRSPQPGEPAAFQAEWRRSGYCRVTYVAGPKRTSNALLISGSDVISTEAGGRFLASEESLSQFRRTLGVRPADPMPYFEALLKTTVVNNSVPWYGLVAYRKSPQAPVAGH